MEYDLGFEKFICGVPFSTPIPKYLTLDEIMINEVEKMLVAVSNSWEILKSASPDLIRNEFLQRSGKLDLTDNTPKLTVERKTQDILLDKLPWNLEPMQVAMDEGIDIYPMVK